jgi:hypothetical protein
MSRLKLVIGWITCPGSVAVISVLDVSRLFPDFHPNYKIITQPYYLLSSWSGFFGDVIIFFCCDVEILSSKDLLSGELFKFQNQLLGPSNKTRPQGLES